MPVKQFIRSRCCLVAMFAFMATGFGVDLSAWEVMYSHDQEGRPVSGDKDELIAAVLDGKDVKVRFSWRGWEKTYTPNAVHVFDGEVYAECWALSANMHIDPAGVDYYRWTGTAVFGTDGREVYRMFNGKAGTPRFPMEWLVDDGF